MGYLNRTTGSFRRMTANQIQARRLVGFLDQHELSVLSRLVDGESTSSIAHELGPPVSEIEKARSEILRKFGVGTTADLIRIGIYAELQGPC
jgi:FixJ family two-component response regulator